MSLGWHGRHVQRLRRRDAAAFGFNLNLLPSFFAPGAASVAAGLTAVVEEEAVGGAGADAGSGLSLVLLFSCFRKISSCLSLSLAKIGKRSLGILCGILKLAENSRSALNSLSAFKRNASPRGSCSSCATGGLVG